MEYILDFSFLLMMYFLVFFPKWKEEKETLITHTLLYIYLTFVIYFTLMPVISSIPYILSHSYVSMNLLPFSDLIYEHGDYIRQIVLNILMTIPFGILYPLTQKENAGFLKTVLMTLGLSLSIELIQPLISGFRSSDITDLITNTCGGVIGYGFYKLFQPYLMKMFNRVSSH